MQQLEIYVGGDIVHRSELDVVQALSELSDHLTEPMVVLANVSLSARQLDFIIVSERGVHVVDAKSTSLPVRGGENGEWSRLQPDGSWSWYTNGYAQVLACKYILKNTVLKAFPSFYPEAAVVFAGGLPQGSTVTTGDFKARVTDVGGLMGLLKQGPGSNPLSLDEWRRIATSLGLRSVTVAEVLSPDLNHPVRLYRDGFRDEYASIAAGWVPESDEQRGDIQAAAAIEGGLYLYGPSGCAKSLAATFLALEASDAGAVALHLAAKQYSGSLSALIAAEVAQVADMTWPALMKSVQATGTPLLITLDGLNELKAEEAKKLLRGIRAISRRYGARLIVTSQYDRPSDLAGLTSLAMPVPSLSLKERIATAHARAPLSPAAVALLPAVNSGIEAAALGELQDSLPNSVTRVQLIDQFIRYRVGEGARRCMSALRQLARHLLDQSAFSLSEPTYDLALSAWGFSAELGDALLKSGILVRHAGRVSFLHEMYCNGCASVSYAHEAIESTDAIIKRLNAAIFKAAAPDVVAAIEDEDVCHNVLSGLSHAQALTAALGGELGAVAKQAGERVVADVLQLVSDEIDQVELEIVGEGTGRRLDWKKERCTTYSAASTIQLRAIGARAQHGGGLEPFMALCRDMEAKLQSERARLSEAAEVADFALKSNAYALAFHGHWGTTIGFAHIFGATQPLFDRYKGPAVACCGPLGSLTPGELEFVIEHFTLFFGEDHDALIAELISVFCDHFSRQPYHVKLALLHVVGWVRDANEASVAELVEVLNAIDANRFGWAISSSIVDALRILGGLENDAEASREFIAQEIHSMLEDPDSEETFERALTLYCATYDHPFDYVYGEEMHALPDLEKRRLYRRALRAPSIRQSMSLRWLTDEVAETADNADLPVMAQFAGLPGVKNPMRQDEIAAFVTAVRVHARLRAPLPDIDIQTDGDRCFAALRTIVYATEQEDLSGSEAAWASLSAQPPSLAMGCISEVTEALAHYPYPRRPRVYGNLSLLPVHQAHLLAIARRFARAGESARSARGYLEQRGTALAMSILGSHGDRGDLAGLRALLEQAEFSDGALGAIKSIEQRG